MDFTNYLTDTARLAPDLVNTLGVPSGTENLPDAAALRSFLRDHGVEPPDHLDESDVEAIRTLRARVRTAFEAASESDAAAIINSLITEAGTLPQLTDHDGHWHMHFTSMNAPIVDRVAAIVGMTLAQVIAQYGKERLGICNADDCGDVFLDTSRNRSRRYCNETCSTRTNVAAYRARQR